MSSENTKFKYTLTKRQIVENLVHRMSLSQEEALKIVDMIFEQMSECLASDARIELRDFGVFEPKTLVSFVGRNPLKPNETHVIPERKTVAFHPSKKMRERLNGKDGTQADG
jgi:nucleoid DNA-binding protein